MAMALAYLRVPLTWREIFTRTVREAMADNIMGDDRAARVSAR
jgi:hypothetical protein